MTNDHVVARFSDPLNRVTITKGCYSAKANNKRWLSENETYCSTRSVLRGEHIPKYHDINFAICIQPKQAERGILLLPQYYHKLCAHSFSQYQTDEMKLLYRCTFFCYCLFSIFEWKRLKHKQTCPPLLLPSTLVPFPCCNKSGCKWMGHEEYNSAVQTREQ